MLAQYMQKKFIQTLKKIKYGQILLTFPDKTQKTLVGKEPGPNCDLEILNNKFYAKVAFSTDTGFAEAYANNYCDSKDLSNLICFFIRNIEVLGDSLDNNFIHKVICKVNDFFKRNTVKQSKQNIASHYDLSNDFYKLWLDQSLTYSSGIFTNENEDLFTAQQNKYNRILNHLNPNKSVLEIGTGWGGFINNAHAHGFKNITGITISKQQFKHLQENHKSKANILFEDYRNIKDKFDAIVSIEMIEAVGEQYWPVYFNTIKNCLNKNGSAIIQAILINDKYFDSYRKGSDFIRRMIFPGGMLLSKNTIYTQAKNNGLAVTDYYEFGLSYAKTLQCWLEKFDSKKVQIKRLGFSDYFIKVWRMYLCYCIAGFLEKRISVAQIKFEHNK